MILTDGFLTHYHPIFDSNGKCVCYVGVDISMVLLRTYRLKFLFRTIILSLVAVILVVELGLWISTKFLVNPINGISRHAIDFMGKNGNVDGMNACVSAIKISTSALAMKLKICMPPF